MFNAVVADLLLLAHALFVLFVLLGGILALRHPPLAVWHLPAVVWGVLMELSGWVCPLTQLENRFRRLGGEAGYGGSCIEHYLQPILYPIGLTERLQYLLALLLVTVNLAVYLRLWWRRHR
jgi:hypothetical protein